jgi:very-short-patch-repair endonuclease
MLVIEVDGPTHDRAEEVERDEGRDAYLRSQGWQVFRLPNVAVYENIGHVVNIILSQVPPPALRATSPAGGGG